MNDIDDLFIMVQITLPNSMTWEIFGVIGHIKLNMFCKQLGQK